MLECMWQRSSWGTTSGLWMVHASWSLARKRRRKGHSSCLSLNQRKHSTVAPSVQPSWRGELALARWALHRLENSWKIEWIQSKEKLCGECSRSAKQGVILGERSDRPSEVLELMHTDGTGLITLNQLVLENKFTYPDGRKSGRCTLQSNSQKASRGEAVVTACHLKNQSANRGLMKPDLEVTLYKVGGNLWSVTWECHREVQVCLYLWRTKWSWTWSSGLESWLDTSGIQGGYWIWDPDEKQRWSRGEVLFWWKSEAKQVSQHLPENLGARGGVWQNSQAEDYWDFWGDRHLTVSGRSPLVTSGSRRLLEWKEQKSVTTH